MRSVRNQIAREKNKTERILKDQEYQQYLGGDWANRGIVVDMPRLFGTKPVREELLRLAYHVTDVLGIPLGRQEKRVASTLIGWFNKNYDAIRPLLSRIVCVNSDGHIYGEHADVWEKFRKENPDDDLVQVLNP